MPGSATLVQIALGLAAIGAVLLVLRWAWNARRREGGTREKAEALERAVVGAAKRDQRTRKQEALSHGAWKTAGKARRGKRKPR